MTSLVTQETEVACAAQELLLILAEQGGWSRTFADERTVTIDGNPATPDAIICDATEAGDTFGILETKVSASNDALEQVARWIRESEDSIPRLPLVNFIWLAVKSPDRRTKSHDAKRRWLESKGAGLIYVQQGLIAEIQFAAKFQENADTRLIEQAFRRANSEFDPECGVKTAKRQTKTRSQYASATKSLRGERTIDGGYGWRSWLWIQRDNPNDEFIQATSSGKATKDCKTGIWRQAEVNAVVAPAVFRFTGKK